MITPLDIKATPNTRITLTIMLKSRLPWNNLATARETSVPYAPMIRRRPVSSTLSALRIVELASFWDFILGIS